MFSLLVSVALAAPAAVGQPAPAFSLAATDGATHSLAQYAGKTVVLEWYNPDCPFVKYAHGPGGPLTAQPTKVTGSGVVWLAINSGAPGKQGADPARNVQSRTEYGITYPVLLDPTGTAGQAYGATNTPQMYVIDAKGTLVYAGALDNAPLGTLEGPAAVNYVDAALADVAAGRPVATPTKKAYGCSVKYGS